MKELGLNKIRSEKQSIESVQKKQQAQELKYIGDLKPKRGHKLFEINRETLEVKEAELMVIKNLDWFDALKAIKGDYNHKVIVKRNCDYISALNASNALERWNKGKGSSVIPKAKMNLNIYE